MMFITLSFLKNQVSFISHAFLREACSTCMKTWRLSSGWSEVSLIITRARIIILSMFRKSQEQIFGNRDSPKTRNTTPFYIFKKAPATRDIYNKVASSQGRKRFKDFLHHSKIQICKANSGRKTNALRLREIHKPFQTRIECLNTSSKCKALRFKRKVPLCDLVRPF
ncbi:unnamed protein product [Moneuplotes crassus]|uniref:Uncharacterized protein n=1 Tax=Euplotes crassus TaxID=5936 RepID=A0AAD1X6P1_EUPCR|nr:unnamed protein product [Moneuplotes crassus]